MDMNMDVEVTGPVAGAGRPRRRTDARPPAQRAGAWLVWWALLMALWVWVDDSLLTAELAVGAAAAALAATFVELAQHQADSRLRIRAEWLGDAVTLPWQVARDTGVVLAALWRQLATGIGPDSGFEEVAAPRGDDSVESASRRVLLIGETSLAPNTFALGVDGERGVMVVHRLVRGVRR